MTAKFGKFNLTIGLLIYHVMRATVRYRLGRFLLYGSKHCIKCQSRNFLNLCHLNFASRTL